MTLPLPFPDQPGPTPRRRARVLMKVADAGDYNYREWWCAKCDHRERVHHKEDPPNSYRRPCPVCPQPWTEPDPYPVDMTAGSTLGGFGIAEARR